MASMASTESYFVRPIQQFEDNVRPARLMLNVYRLLDCRDDILTEGDLVSQLRALVNAGSDEDLMVIRNEIFLGMIRENAQLAPSELKTRALCHLLRQAVVASCTALDAYLPALLRVDLPAVIRIKGRKFFPNDKTVTSFFEDLSFSLAEVLRLLGEDDANIYLSNKILGLASFKYLSSKKGIHVTCALLGLEQPWSEIAVHLSRDRKEMMTVLDETVKRRNDIVHRADRSSKDPDGEQQRISYAQARQGVDTISHVCHAIDELVELRKKQLAKRQPGSAQ